MDQTELLQVLRQQPFRPFRILLSNNESYEIHHSDMAIATPWAIHVGIPSSTAKGSAAQEVVIVSMYHIVQIDYLSPPSDTKSTSKPSKN